MQQRDVAERLEAQQFGLRQPLLREARASSRPAARAAVAAATWMNSRREIMRVLRAASPGDAFRSA